MEKLEPVGVRGDGGEKQVSKFGRDILIRQIAHEEEQRSALAAFLGGWDAAGGGAPAERWTVARKLRRVPDAAAERPGRSWSGRPRTPGP
ncbi:hypothetical protein [Streptomyces sp. NPDC047725]|uniref:hypothetical protein n=1 Tax=Streptomyces sp. NPDC047725 TaxID=3365487 RepID=UPI0037159B75